MNRAGGGGGIEREEKNDFGYNKAGDFEKIECKDKETPDVTNQYDRPRRRIETKQGKDYVQPLRGPCPLRGLGLILRSFFCFLFLVAGYDPVAEFFVRVFGCCFVDFERFETCVLGDEF